MPVAQAMLKDSDQRETWLMQVRAWLWDRQFDEVIQACEPCRQPQLKPEDDPAYIAACYFTNHRHQMDDPTCRTQGYQVGSGTMESGSKQIGLNDSKSQVYVGAKSVRAWLLKHAPPT